MCIWFSWGLGCQRRAVHYRLENGIPGCFMRHSFQPPQGVLLQVLLELCECVPSTQARRAQMGRIAPVSFFKGSASNLQLSQPTTGPWQVSFALPWTDKRRRPSLAQIHLPFTTAHSQQSSQSSQHHSHRGIKSHHRSTSCNYYIAAMMQLNFVARSVKLDEFGTSPRQGRCACGSSGWSAMFSRAEIAKPSVSRQLPSHLALSWY